MNNEKFDLGRQIGRVLDERRMMKCVLAQKLGVSESTAINLTKRKTMDVEMLQKIGNVLRYNFFKHYAVEDETGDGGRGTGDALDKDKVIEDLRARNAELERQVEEMKGLEVIYMKQSNDDLRRANEMLLASLKPKMSVHSMKVRRKAFNNENGMFG